jgi:hypothetical protein
MLSKRKRVGAALAAMAFAASLALTQAVSSTPALARCAGENNVVESKLIVAGVTYVTETPTSSTCNGTVFYSSQFQSHVAGWRASIRIQNNGRWTGHYGGYNMTPIRLEYEDDNSNSLMVLCADDGTTWMCGYHTDVFVTVNGPSELAWRTNYGF